MPGEPFPGLVLPENIIRDISLTFINTGNQAFDFSQSGSIGLDAFIINQGAAALTIAFNGQGGITVAAGAAFGWSSTRYWLVEVVSAVNYDLIIAGVRYATLKAKGLVP